MPAVSSAELDGKPLIALLLPHDTPDSVGVVLGTAQAGAGALLLLTASGRVAFSFPSHTLTYNCFRSQVLPALTASRGYAETLRALSAQAEWCAVAFADALPREADVMPMLLAGLATGPEGQIYLMQAPAFHADAVDEE